MNRLPASPAELRGLRAARWIRESKREQYDNWGPDAQRRKQAEAIERLGLVDTGIEWVVAHSGRTIGSTSQWRAMLEAAGAQYDVLLVGYTSRFSRNLKTTLVGIEDHLHPAGAVVLFCDEGVVSSDPDEWERWSREAHEAESYSRRMGRRIREGYAARRRRLADPGGTPPFGFHRDGPDKVVTPNPVKAAAVLRIFELAAARSTDREVAAATGLTVHVVRTTLRSPLYAGRLPDGSRTMFPAPVDPELWHQVQEVRARRRTRDGRPAKKSPYALTMLRCKACGRRLIGDVGRYRHPDVCDEFRAAVVQPTRRIRGQHREILGASYPVAAYEGAVRKVLERVSLGASLVAEVLTDPPVAAPDRLASARIGRERDAALAKYSRDRDTRALEAAMARLDVESAELAAAPVAYDPKAALEYLQSLATLWDDAPIARRRVAEALFASMNVIGIQLIELVPSPAAIDRGLAEAFRSGSGGYGRGGGSRVRTFQIIARLVPGVDTTIRIVVPPAPTLRLVRSA